MACFLAVDGWSHHLRSGQRSPTGALADLPSRNARSIRRTLRGAGFEAVTLYGVFPSVAEPRFIYPLSDDAVVEWFVENHLEGWVGVAARASRAIGVFGAGQPGYLAVCGGAPDDSRPGSSLTRLTYNRVLSFELDGGRLTRVEKAPRPCVGDGMNRREQHVLDYLHDASVPDDIAYSLPTGTLTSSPTGAARLESAAYGTLVGKQLDADPTAVRNVLDTAFDWLARFQQTYRGERVVRDPDELRRRARCPELGVTNPPALDEPVSSFVSPCHGDFHPWNVFVDDTGVSGVIDWEYAMTRGDPALDAARFLLFVCGSLGDGFEAGFETLCASETPYSTRVRAALDRYRERVGLDRRAVVAAFPYAHAHILRTLREQGRPPAHAELTRTFEPRVAAVVENFDRSVEILG